MTPPTILQCLDLRHHQIPLPDFPDADANGKKEASELGESTKKAAPPYFAIHRPRQYYIDIGHRVLYHIVADLQLARNHAAADAAKAAKADRKSDADQRKAAEWAAARIKNPLEEEYISLKEHCLYHVTEADVVRAAAIYLMHPVNQGLDAFPEFAKTIETQAEFQRNRMRTDITYFKAGTQPGRPHRSFAVMEFKRRGILQAKQFENAIQKVDVGNPAQVRQAIAAAKQQPKKNENSFFSDNALKAIKQVAAYSVDHRIRYAVLFDWDVLVLVKFPQNSFTAPVQPPLTVSAGDYCELTVITHATESHLMRPALLGFLAEACNETPAN